MSDIREAIRIERESLERELQKDPRFLKLQHLKELQALYEGQMEKVPVAVVQSKHSAKRPAARRINPDREKALSAAAEFIRGRSEPIKTSEILSYFDVIGIPVAGTVPLSNLSAMLHHSPLFHSHGRRGWTLVNLDASSGDETERASNDAEGSDNVIKDPMWDMLA